MLDASNLVVISGNLTKDPEIFKDKVLKASVAVSYAGSEDNTVATGFFDVTMFLNDDNKHSDFVKRQVESNKMKKGSSVAIVGKLSHERWKNAEGQVNSRVRIIAESLSYGSSSSSEGTKKAEPDAGPAASVPDVW